jgi:transposase
MSAAFLAAAAENFPHAAVTVDWFHVVQVFTTAVDAVRRAEARRIALPKGVRWATLKRPEELTAAQRAALEELETGGFATAEAYRAKELLRWVRNAATPQAARWRLTHFLRHVGQRLDPTNLVLDPVRDAVKTVRRHANASFAAGNQATPTRGWKRSMASSRQPAPVPADTAPRHPTRA